MITLFFFTKTFHILITKFGVEGNPDTNHSQNAKDVKEGVGVEKPEHIDASPL